MATDSSRLKVGDLIRAGVLQIGDGYRAKNAELADYGVPFARAGNVKSGFDFSAADRVPPETLARAGDKRSRVGDVVFTSKGTVGRLGFVSESTEPFVLSPQLCFWRVLDERIIDPRWLFHWFHGPEAADQLSWIKGQTDMADYVSLRDQREMTLTIPSISEQRAIAMVLGVLDDKIESNLRLADAARDVLRTIVRSSGEPMPLDTVATFRNGGALTKHANGRGKPILRIKELKAGVTAETPRTDQDVREQHHVRDGNLLFSWSGTLLTHRWSGGPAVLNQHVFRVDPDDGVPTWLVEAWIEQHINEFRRIAADKATTMGHIQRRHLSEAMIAMPSREDLVGLRRTYDPLDELRIGLLIEARTITALRDALLPKLVSGQIRVPLSSDGEAVETFSAEIHEGCAAC